MRRLGDVAHVILGNVHVTLAHGRALEGVVLLAGLVGGHVMRLGRHVHAPHRLTNLVVSQRVGKRRRVDLLLWVLHCVAVLAHVVVAPGLGGHLEEIGVGIVVVHWGCKWIWLEIYIMGADARCVDLGWWVWEVWEF